MPNTSAKIWLQVIQEHFPFLRKRPIVVSLLLFPLSFILLFYVPMLLFSPGYSPSVPFFIYNYLLFFLPTFFVYVLPGPRRLFLVLLYFFFLLPSLATAGYIYIYSSPPATGEFFFLWETNIYEAVEFATDVLSKKATSLFLPIVGILMPFPFLIVLFRNSHVVSRSSIRARVYLASAIFICLTSLIVLQNPNHNFAYHFYHSLYSYRRDLGIVREVSKQIPLHQASLDISRDASIDMRETYVVVIGESASRHHMGLYGYPRETDPEMSRLLRKGELLAFNNVTTNNMGTTYSLIHALTFKDHLTKLETLSLSIVDVFNAAGFETFWLTNNAVQLQYDTLLKVLWQNADHKYFTQTKQGDTATAVKNDEQIGTANKLKKSEENISFDGALLPIFEKALSSSAKKRIFFIHLKGSHVDYWYRFPQSHEKFTDKKSIVSKDFPLSEQAVQIINNYDNSIHYTDYILGRLIERLRKEEGASWLLYFGDHGDEVYDFRDHYGRDQKKLSKYMFDTPLMVWFSPYFNKIRDIEALRQYSDRPFDIDSLIHSIVDLSSLKTPKLDPARSLFSGIFVTPARFVTFGPYLELPPLDMYNKATVSDEIRAIEEFYKTYDE